MSKQGMFRGETNSLYETMQVILRFSHKCVRLIFFQLRCFNRLTGSRFSKQDYWARISCYCCIIRGRVFQVNGDSCCVSSYQRNTEHKSLNTGEQIRSLLLLKFRPSFHTFNLLIALLISLIAKIKTDY